MRISIKPRRMGDGIQTRWVYDYEVDLGEEFGRLTGTANSERQAMRLIMRRAKKYRRLVNNLSKIKADR